MKKSRRKTWQRFLSLFLVFMLTFSTVSSSLAEELPANGASKSETVAEPVKAEETAAAAPETQAPSETTAPETQAPSETTAPETQAPSETTAPETQAPSETTAPETQAPSETSAPETQPSETAGNETVPTEDTEQSETQETDALESELPETETGAGETAETEAESESEETELFTEEESESEAIQELAENADVIGAEGEESLLALTRADGSMLSVSAASNVDKLSRNASFDVSIAYSFGSAAAVDNAKRHMPWVYDLTEFVKNNPVKDFTEVTGTSYRIMDGSNERGYYQVIGNRVLLYVKEEWLAQQTSNVSGTFTLTVSLDSSRVGSETSHDFSFPGSAAPIRVTYEYIKVNSSKKVEGAETNDGGIKQITANADGSYTLHYEIWVQSPVALESLVLTDTASANQKIDRDSFTIRKNGGSAYSIPQGSVQFTGDSSFTLDVANAWRANPGESFQAGESYFIGYTTTVSADAVASNEHLTNTSAWSWDGGGSRPGGSTDIRIRKALTVDKNVVEEVNQDEETVYKYTITVGDGTSDLAGHKITDWMTDLQVLDGAITLSPTEGTLPSTITPDWTDDGVYSNNDVKLFEYTFPDDQEYKGPYTITYQTKLVEEVEGLYGPQHIRNKVKEEGDDTDKEVSTDTTHDYGDGPEKEAEVRKTLYEWDAQNQQILYDVNVAIEEDAELPLKNVVVKELEATYGYNEWWCPNQLEILWDQISVTDADGNAMTTGYTVDAVAGTVTFAELSGNVKIRVVAKSPVDFANLPENWGSTEFWAYNKVELTVDGDKQNESKTRDKYVSSEYSMNKTGSYDPETQEFTWVVTINPEKAKINPDRNVYFTDTLPEGMELVDGKIYVNFDGKDSDGVSFGNWNVYFSVTCTDGVIAPVMINDNPWGDQHPAGLSGMRYQISYKTRLTEAEQSAVVGSNKTYRNVAREVGADGTELKSASAEVEYKYSYMTKEDLSPRELEFDQIEYEVIVNPDELTLNDGNALTVSDVIAPEVELVVNSISVTDKNGAALSDVLIGYDDVSRTVTFTLPDRTYARVTFRVMVQELTDGYEFINGVNLSGKTSYHTETSKEHVVKRHSATIVGQANEIKLHKVDQYNLTKDLAGAVFELYEVAVDENGNLGDASPVTNLEAEDGRFVSGTDGVVSFGGLTPGSLYYWVEVSAPDGYAITSSSNHFFIMHSDDEESKQSAEALRDKIKANSGLTVPVLRDHYMWTVTNLKASTVKAQIEVSKVLTGRDLAEGEFAFKLTAGTNTAEGDIVTPMPASDTVRNTAAEDGEKAEFSFGEISYTAPGEYHYTVEEIEGTLANVTYDPTEYNVTVTVGRNEETGELEISQITYSKADGGAVSEKAEFRNVFRNKGSLVINKSTVGATPNQNESFYFTVQNADGQYYDLRSKTFTDEIQTIEMTFDDSDMTLELLDMEAGEYTVTETADRNGTPIENSSSFRYLVTGNGQTVEVPVGGAGEVDITNTLEQVSATVKKVWDDADNQDGKRPTSIQVVLKKNGSTIRTVELSEANGWMETVNELDKYTGGKENVYTWAESGLPEGYSLSNTDKQGSVTTLTNSYTPETTWVDGSKTWEDNNDQDGKRPESIIIRLWNGETQVAEQTVTPDSAGNWSWSFTNLPKYEGGEEIAYTITEDAVPGYTSEVNGYNVTNTHTPETTRVDGSKTWNDNDDQDGKRPASITIRLFADGEEVAHRVVMEADGWSWSFTDLQKYEDGEEIAYTIAEDPVADYSTAYDGYNVINSYTPGKTSVSGSKTWHDSNDRDGKRPESITIHLLADGKEVAHQVVTEADGWNWSFENLDEYKDGQMITYRITEDPVAGYTSHVSGYNVTNSYTPETTEVSGSKTWNDNDDQDGKRPGSIIIRLWNGETEVAHQEVTPADGNWSWRFTDLPKYEGGEEIAYTITEDVVPGYTSQVSGYNVTNSYTPETTQVVGSKTWNDNDDQDGKRPGSITIRLLANGEEVDHQEVTPADGNWSWSFTDLPKYEGGEEIVYTITEDPVADYSTTYDGYNVTNSYTPGKTSVSGSKTWNDNDDQDGKRPGSITIRLLADGKEVDYQEVTPADGNWSWSFTDLPVYEAGEEIAYTITEDSEAGYTSEVNGYNVTNTHTPETTQVVGSKTWNDNDDQDGKRPGSITIRLLANGEEVAHQEVTPADGNWRWSFTDLPKYEGGKEIVYTITEDAVVGYETVVDDYNVTNTHTPETTEVNGSKTWDDNDDQDGKRPESITIRLWNGETQVAEQEVTPAEDGTWTWSFTDLPKYEAGEEIVYTITEDPVGGYEAVVNEVVDGYNVTNTHTPETTDITGSKTWVGNDNQGAKRPESITIRLWNGETQVAEQEVTPAEDGTWTWSFTDLPVYEAGEEIAYTITEDPVDGWLSEVNGYDVTNTITSVFVNKTDVSTGEALAGAHIQVLDAQGNVVDEWDSTGEAHEVTGLSTGVTYTLHETAAPDGYVITVDTAFSLNEDGSINAGATTAAMQDGVLLVEDARSVEVSKVDGVTGETLTGAHIQVLDAQGSVVDEWDSEAGANHVVRNLRVNTTYTLRETSAPDGYERTEDTSFTIDAEGNVTGTVAFDENGVVLIRNERTQSEDTSITVLKTVSYNGFSLFAEDVTFWAALYYDEACTQLAAEPQELRIQNAASGQATFDNLEIGRTYYVGECDADGNVIYSGEVTGGTTYQARFTGTNGNTVVTREGEDIIVALDNQLEIWPDDGFYTEGKLTVTKRLLNADGTAADSDEVFYAGIFADPEYTTLFDGAESNILTLDLAGGSEATASTQIVLPDLDSVVTLYVTEVDADGTPVAGAAGFVYEVDVDQTSVTLDTEHSEASVVITNTIPEEEEEESESETEIETETETERETTPRTGDDTPVMPLVSTLAVSGLAVLLLLVYKRRREEDC